MGFTCCVKNCNSAFKKQGGLILYSIPTNPLRFKMWTEAIGRTDIDISKRVNYRVCELHFSKEMKTHESRGKLRTNLKANAIPNLFLNGHYEDKILNGRDIEDSLDNCNSEGNHSIIDNTNENVIDPGIRQDECSIVEKWNDKCIACLKDDAQMETINSLSVLSGFKELFDYLGIREYENEASVNSVCTNCVLQMYNLLNFKRQCEESREKLGLYNPIYETSLVVEEPNNEAEISIKQEFNSIKLECKSFVPSPPEAVQSSTNFGEEIHELVSNEIKQEISYSPTSTPNQEPLTSVKEELDDSKQTEIEDDINSETLKEVCITCNEKFTDKILLKRHQIFLHGLKNCIQECSECNELYFLRVKYEFKLKLHNEKHHENICSVCDLKFPTIFHLAKHRLLHICNVNTQQFHHGRRVPDRRPVGKVACALCNKIYVSYQALKEHLKTYHNRNTDKISSCTICKRSVYNMKEHLKRHRKGKTKEISTATNQKNGLCTHCGKLFSSNTALKIHIKAVHLRIKNFQCGYCNKMFVTTGLRTTHIKKMHLKLKRFSCDICKRKFFSKYELKNHKMSHTGEKIRKCPYCDVLLCWTSLKYHKRRVHGMIL